MKYGAREPRAGKLDPCKSYLLKRVEQARPDWIAATMLMREIGAMGIRRWLHAVRTDPVVRFETEPGQNMHADFTTIRRGRDRLLAFVATLGLSCATFVHFTYLDQTLFWNGLDLHRKLNRFATYYNERRVHAGLNAADRRGWTLLRQARQRWAGTLR